MEDWTSKIEFLTLTVNNFVSENKKIVFNKELCSCKGNFTNGAVEGIQLRCFLKKENIIFSLQIFGFLYSSCFGQLENEYCGASKK